MQTKNQSQGGVMKNQCGQHPQTNLQFNGNHISHPYCTSLKPTALRNQPLRWLAGALALFLFLTGPAHARRFVLEKGKGVEVCEAYGKNLNFMVNAPDALPFSGMRPINPEFTDFSKPGIADNDVSSEDTAHFVEEMNHFLWQRDVNPVYYIPVTDWPKWRGMPEQRKKAWKTFSEYRERWHFLDIVKVDIDNDGVVEQVAMLR